MRTDVLGGCEGHHKGGFGVGETWREEAVMRKGDRA